MTESDICLDELYQVPRRARAGTAASGRTRLAGQGRSATRIRIASVPGINETRIKCDSDVRSVTRTRRVTRMGRLGRRAQPPVREEVIVIR